MNEPRYSPQCFNNSSCPVWIVGVSKKTSPSDHLPLRRALAGVSTRLAALFEQKQTLGKREETAQSAHDQIQGMLNRY